FPVSVLLRKLVPALLAGNAVVIKGSELTPRSTDYLVRAFQQAGVPPGVLSNIVGGAVAGAALVNVPEIAALSFTGSTATGNAIAKGLAGRRTKIQLELGGKNAAVILSDADIESAVKIVAQGAFNAAGQWCSATSRVVVEN